MIQVRATNPYGYRYGWNNPWGDVMWIEPAGADNNPCLCIRFDRDSSGILLCTPIYDHWPLNDLFDRYEYRVKP
jgi:hypothetical protein